MGVKWQGKTPSQFATQIKNVPIKLEDEAGVVVTETLEEGQMLMREFIATRGTGYVGKGARATPEGRIDSGDMYDDVGYTKVSKTRGKFGWGTKGASVPNYYAIQEYRTTPRGFPPMHALTDAFVRVSAGFEKKIRRMVRDATQ